MQQAFSVKRSITQKLLWIVFSIYLLVTVIVTTLQMVLEYQLNMSRLEEELSRVESILRPNTVEFLQDRNFSAITRQLQGVLYSEFVAGIRYTSKQPPHQIWQFGQVYDEKHKTPYQHLRQDAGLSAVSSWFLSLFYKPPVHHLQIELFNEKTKQWILMGEVDLYANTKNFYTELRSDWLSILSSAFIESVSLSILFCWAGYRYLNRPLRTLSRSLTRFSQGQLEGAKVRYIGADNTEIEVLGRTFNDMIDKMIEAKKIQEMLVQAEKMTSVGQLAAGMAHEVNNPLSSILQNLQNIRRRLDPQLEKNQQAAQAADIDLTKVKVYLETRGIATFLDNMKTSGERAAHIVSNLLRFSRKAAEDQRMFMPSRLDEIVEKAIELIYTDWELKTQLDFESIHIQRQYDLQGPVALCEPTEIQQVVLNLIKNAAQAMLLQKERKAKPCIIVRTVVSEDNQWAQIEVRDNGPGMDENTRRRVFEPFFTTKEVGKGTGLGLSVAFHIIGDIHKGRLQVESQLGVGTTFSILLPKA